MLTTEEIKQHFDGLSFPAGMSVAVGESRWEGPYVRIVWDRPDSFYPERSIDLGVRSFLSPNDRANVDTLDKFIDWRIWRMFGHEARESVQRDGKPLFDPHAED